MDKKYDVVIIGAGPGGYIAALRAAQLGASVALVEKDSIGGTCLNRGCIPTKAILACAGLFEKFQKAQNFGITAENISIDMQKVVERKNKIIEKLVKGISFLLEKNQVEVIHGSAKVIDPKQIEISSLTGNDSTELVEVRELITGNKLILATGSSPTTVPGIPFDGKKYLSSDHILNYTQIPKKLNIVGGGVVGFHFAYLYSALGSEVTIYEALPDILQGVELELVAQIKRILARKKINILTNTKFVPSNNEDVALICTGRIPNMTGLENLGLKLDGNKIWTNDRQETSIPGVYAIGDVASRMMFAHVASEQGIIAAENALGASKSFNYGHVPYTIYTNPEIAGVGLIEGPRVGKFPFAALGIAQAMGEIEGFIKVISDENGKILGVHIIGPEANTIIGAAVIAIKNKLTVDQLAETIQAHPSFPEGLQEAALNVLKRSFHTLNS